MPPFQNSAIDLPETKSSPKTSTAKPYSVIVLNDPVNLMSYVILIFQKVFGFSKTKATKHMFEVHELGKSTVWTGHKELAESYLYTLQQWHLNAIIEQNE